MDEQALREAARDAMREYDKAIDRALLAEQRGVPIAEQRLLTADAQAARRVAEDALESLAEHVMGERMSVEQIRQRIGATP